MKRASLFLALLLLMVGCSSGNGDLANAGTQKQFGVRMARMNLWREATFRFQRAAEIEPHNAMAHNNLAVALEATGDFDAAAKEYREALRLDRSNEYIQKNYSRFVEFTQRSKKREQAAPSSNEPDETVPSPPSASTPAPTTTPANPPQEGA